jgi:hypothetical protein
MWKWIGAACVVVAVAVYLEYVQDIRTPRAELVVAGVVGINQQIPTGQIPGRFLDAIGVTLVGGVGDAPFGIFPFRIGPNAAPEPTRASVLGHAIQERFKSVLAPGAMDFTESDYAIENCLNLSADDLGLKIARPLLQLGKTTLCTVVWKKTRTTRMLIGITMADGGFWIRPFGRSVCRTLARAWLRKAQTGQPRPDFLQCMLVDRPASKSDAVLTSVYQVRADGSLALGPGGSRVVPLLP